MNEFLIHHFGDLRGSEMTIQHFPDGERDTHLMTLREALASFVATLPANPAGHPTQVEKNNLLDELQRLAMP